ncbi:uncharacterized protein PHALS_02856 [Plasmopara halstedii]|uniref:Uncharacterized protein n=1 Tax=Plasmopara halstedii TaxID=4781 RepID=A0A0P1AXA8_PLAHL|nr:uncharacterized protein PHALS_02856 [Plasmopara halstedii]CEG46455.1 hypothetical protein PHALS_02856 [Plasmopara halstedii]|eukprot:XP_024582824.1 hypothetical protein PHALS_02856 [Plasmopara halstedii]
MVPHLPSCPGNIMQFSFPEQLGAVPAAVSLATLSEVASPPLMDVTTPPHSTFHFHSKQSYRVVISTLTSAPRVDKPVVIYPVVISIEKTSVPPDRWSLSVLVIFTPSFIAKYRRQE